MSGWLDANVGRRTVTKPLDVAAWIVALAVLVVVIPSNEIIGKSPFFLVAHNTTAWVVAGLWLAVIGVSVALLSGAFWLANRLLSVSAADTVVTVVTLSVTVVLIGNAVARESSVPAWLPLSTGPGASGLIMAFGSLAIVTLAVGFTYLTRRVSMGRTLLVAALIASAIPLARAGGSGAGSWESRALAFANARPPSVLWIIADELQAPVVMDESGRVRPEFPSLRSLQDVSTTYSRAVGVANRTEVAVPAMLNGVADASALSGQALAELQQSSGILAWLKDKYAVVSSSTWFRGDGGLGASGVLDPATAVALPDAGPRGTADSGSVWLLAADLLAVVGRTTLAPQLARPFPVIEGRWGDFWSEPGPALRTEVETKELISILEAPPRDSPLFALWHHMGTHFPWQVDYQGDSLFDTSMDGAFIVGTEQDAFRFASADLADLSRRLYAASGLDFDRTLGEVIAALRSSGAFDETMVIVSADHGRTFTHLAEDQRVGESPEQRWREVAHVPLIVKWPGQSLSTTVDEPSSTGQIAGTIMRAIGVTAQTGPVLSPPLGDRLAVPPNMYPFDPAEAADWARQSVDEWVPFDWPSYVKPVSSKFPFAVGVAVTDLDQPVPSAAVEMTSVTWEQFSGTSDQSVVVVRRPSGQCSDPGDHTLIAAAEVSVGRVLWASPLEPTLTDQRGWVVVPRGRGDDFRFWCVSGSVTPN